MKSPYIRSIHQFTIHDNYSYRELEMLSLLQGGFAAYGYTHPVSEGITESLMQLGANGFGMILLLFINGVFQGQH